MRSLNEIAVSRTGIKESTRGSRVFTNGIVRTSATRRAATMTSANRICLGVGGSVARRNGCSTTASGTAEISKLRPRHQNEAIFMGSWPRRQPFIWAACDLMSARRLIPCSVRSWTGSAKGIMHSGSSRNRIFGFWRARLSGARHSRLVYCPSCDFIIASIFSLTWARLKDAACCIGG